MLCLCEGEMQLLSGTEKAEKQADIKQFGQIPQSHLWGSLCLSRITELLCGGGQIATTGAPQQFSVSKWKPTPTPHPPLYSWSSPATPFISALYFSPLSVCVSPYSATDQQIHNQHEDEALPLFSFEVTKASRLNPSLSTRQLSHLVEQTNNWPLHL